MSSDSTYHQDMSKKRIVFDILVQLSFRPPFLLHRDRYGEYREQAANNAGKTPLDVAKELGHTDVVTYLEGL